MKFSVRSELPELMDAPDFDEVVYRRCLADLARVNRVTLTHRATLRWLQRATRDFPTGRDVSVLDVAFGQGDLLRAIASWAQIRGLKTKLSGVDLNPRSAEAARAATPDAQDITYFTADAFEFLPANPVDFIVTSQFAHHLSNEQIVRLMQWMDVHARRGWLVVDLHRHWFAYYGFPLLARLMRWNDVVRHDGQVSIARSFTRRDWQRLIAAAQIDIEISWKVPFRWQLSRLK